MENIYKILVVDDEDPVRTVFSRQIERLGYLCATASGGKSGVEMLQSDGFDVALVDLIMPDMDGLGLLSTISETDCETVIVMMSGRGTIETAVEAMKLGAFDFLEKDPNLDMLRVTLERACLHKDLRRRARHMEAVAERWDAMFNAVPDLMAVVDTDGRIVHANNAMAGRFHCTSMELAGKSLSALLSGNSGEFEIPDGNFPRVAELLSQRLGAHFVVSTSPVLTAKGEFLGIVLVAHDVTERKRAEDELRMAHRDTERLLSTMSSFLIEVDHDLKVTRWNRAAETTFGIRNEDAAGKSLLTCGIGVDWKGVTRELQTWLDTDRSLRLPEIRYARPDGTDGFLSTTVNPVRNEHDQSVGFFLLGSDITDRKTLEAQLIQAQKLESIGQLAAGIAHEINTPTQYVGDNVEFLQYAFEDLMRLLRSYEQFLDNVKKNEEIADALASMETARAEVDTGYLAEQVPRAIEQSREGIKRVAAIVHAMKEFSHPGTDQKTRFDLNKGIESTVTVSRNEWKYVADLETSLAPDLPSIMGLPGEINQVILNIIVNAAHAIAGVVGDGANGKGKIEISTKKLDDWAEIRISDTGTGIPERARNRIFDPFFTTKDVGKGTGQGLAIAHNVVAEKHGGSITFETEDGKGTTFIIRLPIEAV